MLEAIGELAAPLHRRDGWLNCSAIRAKSPTVSISPRACGSTPAAIEASLGREQASRPEPASAPRSILRRWAKARR